MINPAVHLYETQTKMCVADPVDGLPEAGQDVATNPVARQNLVDGRLAATRFSD
jgi:hypothetical protein